MKFPDGFYVPDRSPDPINLPDPTQSFNNPKISDHEKRLELSKTFTRIKMSSKEFITRLLKKDHMEFNYRQRTWGTAYGSTSTIELVSEIAKTFYKKDVALH
ncbi:hypothetical protein PGT21_009561 [Puccinia graminis f. sp. tritici]|uniref:Uncharacterized protein n=1 Tax=Puccinia graminis f. sp. tritici TaxID=56615 RepID=A0A5B0QA74_PUCGR|nr:hypothetical protein PGT21_009561 [Puccinia graminis f. sp. tritici]